MNSTQRQAPGPVTNLAGPASPARLAGISSFLAHPWQWHHRPCTGRVYAARVALEVIVLLTEIAALAAVPWFWHEPALARLAIAAVPCAISAATAATIRRAARAPADGVMSDCELSAAAIMVARGRLFNRARPCGRPDAAGMTCMIQPRPAGARRRGFPAPGTAGHCPGHEE